MEELLNKILFICIGNSKIVGDSLGPLVGSIILNNKSRIEKNRNILIDIIGTINNPLVYSKIETVISKINQDKYDKIIIIDSALGNKKNIGRVSINNSIINVGKGINEGRILKGDIIFKGIVAQNHYNINKNIEELNHVTLEQIENISKKIIKIIYTTILKSEGIKQ